MPYILNKTNGAILATLADASVDVTTNLTFVGRNYSGYGEIVNENFLKLLENFSNTTAPSKPIQGQLWFDSTNKRLNLCYDGVNFKGVSNIRIQSNLPSNPNVGDFWWDTSKQQLKAYDGTWYVVGPTTSAAARSSWTSIEEVSVEDENTNIPFIEGKIGSNPIAVVSNKTFTPVASSELKASSEAIIRYVKKGITLAGADPATGHSTESTSTGYLLWGTAAHSLSANTATSVSLSSDSTNDSFYIPFASALTGNLPLKTDAGISYNPSTNILNTVASSARYADLAERYEADAEYEPGTVLMIGGEKEVTIATGHGTVAVAGIVSTKPGYLMNSEAGTDKTHPAIALKGRVPCKVVGKINKGDLLFVSDYPGYACRAFNPDDSFSYDPHSIIGKALEDNVQGFGIIEVKV